MRTPFVRYFNMTLYEGMDTKEAKCGPIINSVSFLLLLSHSVDCHHWKGYTGVQPKDKATL